MKKNNTVKKSPFVRGLCIVLVLLLLASSLYYLIALGVTLFAA